VVAAFLRHLAKKVGLQGEHVVEHSVDAPALQAVLRQHTRPFQLPAQRDAERAVDPRPPVELGVLEQLEAPVEGYLP